VTDDEARDLLYETAAFWKREQERLGPALDDVTVDEWLTEIACEADAWLQTTVANINSELVTP
jgi:hypothetical protein